jgi:hypothetical protein
MRFWVAITRGVVNQHATVCSRTPCAPKPGHLTQSPRLSGVDTGENEGEQWIEQRGLSKNRPDKMSDPTDGNIHLYLAWQLL